jgi:hypothetical protein
VFHSITPSGNDGKIGVYCRASLRKGLSTAVKMSKGGRAEKFFPAIPDISGGDDRNF